MPTQGYITEIGAEWEGTTPSSQLQLPIAAAKLRDKANIDGIGFDGSAGIIHYATCTQAANVVAKSASVVDANGNALPFSLVKGSVVYVKFSNSNTAQNPTLNVNNTGAKSIKRYSTTAPSNTASTSWNAGSVVCLVYDGTYWQMTNWLNSTYANYSLGQGYGTCVTPESTTAKIVTLSNYSLSTGGIVAVKFTNAVPANSTMDINSRGSKSIYHRGAPITSGIINAGDTATFIYSTYYHLISLDHIGEYELPIASPTVLGGVKVGAGLSISSGGVLSANGGGVADAVAWGNITGTLADQTDLGTALGLKANTADLSAVAFSNDYEDLDNKPDIPTSTSELDNDSGFLTSADLPQPADSNPLMDGDISIGSSTDYAREDHRHPTDTSRAADTAVVHKAMAEVITGEKTTTADLILRNTTGSTGLGAATPNLVFQRGANTDSYIDWLVGANENGRLVVSSRSAGTDTVRMQLIGSSSLQQLLSSIDIKAPKLITDGGTAQQYVKGNGTLGGNATQSTAGLLSATDKTKLDGIAAGAEVNVQSDWNQTDNSADDFIRNKPNITTYDVFTYGSDATPGVPGTNGLVPAPTFGERTKVLRGDGTWVSLPSASSSVPSMDGAASVGTSTSYSRGDHVHPTDTSRAADNAVVHRYGAETVSGAKTFTNNIKLGLNTTLNFETSQDAGIYVEASEGTNNVKELNFYDIEDDSQVRLTNVATPVQSTDAVNKAYVDNLSENGVVKLNGYSDSYGIHQRSLCAFALYVGGTTMTMTSFTTTGGTGSKSPITGIVFPIGCKIYYHGETEAFAATTSFTSKEFYASHNSVNARYSAVTGSSIRLSSSSASTVYLRVLVANGYWFPYYKNGFTTENIVTSDNLVSGDFYIYLGKTAGANSYTFQLEDNNPLYYYDGTKLIDWATYVAEQNAGATYVGGSGINISGNVISAAQKIWSTELNNEAFDSQRTTSLNPSSPNQMSAVGLYKISAMFTLGTGNTLDYATEAQVLLQATANGYVEPITLVNTYVSLPQVRNANSNIPCHFEGYIYLSSGTLVPSLTIIPNGYVWSNSASSNPTNGRLTAQYIGVENIINV